MTNLNYTPEELIAECDQVITDCVNNIASKTDDIEKNNLEIESLNQNIISTNSRITGYAEANVINNNQITVLNTRIEKTNAIKQYIVNSLAKVK